MTLKVYSHVEFETVNFAPHPKAVFGYLAEAKSAHILFLEKKSSPNFQLVKTLEH